MRMQQTNHSRIGIAPVPQLFPLPAPGEDIAAVPGKRCCPPPSAKRAAVAPTQAELRLRLSRVLPAKMIDRVDAIVSFHCLTDGSLTEIARQRVENLLSNLARQHGLTVTVGQEVWPWLVERGLQEGPGARGILRAVDLCIASALGDYLSGTAAQGPACARILVRDNAVAVVPVPA